MDPSTTNRGDHTAIIIAQAPAAVRRFPYLPAWRVVLCEECGFCLRPGKKALERHLGREHRLRGAELRALVELLESHDVWTPDEGGPPAGRWPTRPVPGLRVHDGYRCAAGGGCDGFVTRNLKSMERHGSKEHGQRAKAHTRNGEVAPLWVACKLQTFYAETRLIRYFVVAVGGGGGGGGGGGATGPARQGDGGRAAAEGALAPPPRPSSSDTADDAFFRALDEDAKVAAEDAKAEARVVEGFGSHRSAVIPWLRRTGIAGYIRGLDKAEMESSIAVPRKGAAAAKEGAAASSCGGDGPELDLILECMEQLLAETHRWCFDGPECKLTWPRQLALSRFRTTDAVARKLRGFDPYKEPATVDTYFGYWKQLVSFYFRAVHRGGHFAGGRGVRTPEDRVRPTRAQSAAWDLVWRRAAEGDTPRLRKALLGFSMSLICHRYKHYRYRSAVLGFAAMRSIQPTTGAWRAAGNYSSFLSGLIWTAQLLVFGASTGHGSHGGDGSGDCTGGNAGKGDDEDDDDDDEGDDGEDEGDGDKNEYAVRCGGGSDDDGEDDEDDGDDDDDDGGSSDGVLQKIEGYCGKYMRPNSETAFGEILAWRLLCREVGNEEVGQHQATWDEDGRGLTYGDVHLRLDEARKLFSSEVERARRLLYDELMFGADNLPRLKAPALKDDLGRRDVGWFFGMHRDNEPVLAPLERALEGVIKSSDALKNSFLDRSGPEVRWRSKAIALYEATVDSFLTALASPFHMANGQPLRESELFSITWRNTQRHRSIGLKHGRVMVHVTYHKGQQQTGRYKDNIRFLHPAMGDMLIDYMVYVLPLRLAFARHSSPKAVMSPYLWSKGGSVWADNRLSRCMEKASARAQIPRLRIANWRQMTVSIVKTKFTKEEARCFDIAIDDGGEEGEDAEEIDDDVRAMTKQRNHSTRTVNHAYSNQQGASFGGVWDGLVRRGLRASILWQQLWDLDTVLAPSACDRKRCCSEAGLLPGGPELLKRIAMGTYRRRTAWTSKALLQQARALYKDDALRWKSAAQERAMAVVTSRAEQVVIVLGTGEGKSLLFMLPCVLPGAGVTVLVLPLVSLRGDLLRRVRELGIGHHVWSLEEPDTSAPLVFVAVEAAATSRFRAFAAQLAAKQELDRIVVDEAHLTVTASDYRPAMVDLALIRSVRTQFVYLTATLPPGMQDDFELQNHLVRPRVVRASTNRKNLFYCVERNNTRKPLLQDAADRVWDAWHRSGLFDQARDKIILYTPSTEAAAALSALLGCAEYTSGAAATADEKQQILKAWLAAPEQPYIVSTSALSAGFDYAHVRLVMHVDEPHSLVDFAQESGRAGRDGARAYSVVLLRSGWEPPAGEGVPAGKRALHGYLEARDCLRRHLSGHLDLPSDVIVECRDGVDVTCKLCEYRRLQPSEAVDHSAAVMDGDEPTGSADAAGTPEILEAEHTGSAIIEAKRRAEYLELSRYEDDLMAVVGTCLLCRGLGEPWDHTLDGCPWRFDYCKARDRARDRGRHEGGDWIAKFHACYWCYNPQTVCARAGSGGRAGRCSYGDIVMPLCYGLFRGPNGVSWVRELAGKTFKDVDDFLFWCGKATTFGGGKAIQAVCVAADALAHFAP
ncbi:P-loop containing nucleoside triphosphate hydrolase protein [Purpureocillium lavendulum]|uniref:DNA 3'-5' helicase n=1 Tax=Purpureocillium lavendulum TaxID=1247861 RepID=A0AB34FFU1_9HYPO|nr:P-loop containing nucleoside triphosphate hydrolase protein [Purpureocillium lavendulum]